MKSEVTSSSQTDASVKINLNQTALEPFVKQTLNHLRMRVKAAGFRPGKAPDHIVERELGSEMVQNEVLETAVKDSYAAAVKEHNLPVIAPPEVNIIKFVPYTELEYTATVAVMPSVQLPDFKKIKTKREAVAIADDEVDRVIVDLQRRLANRQPVDRAAKEGDEVNIDFEGFKDGQPVAGAASKSYDLTLGSDSFIPGFEAQLFGMKNSESKEFDITFPQDYSSPELAGQKLLFKVKLNQVSQMDLPVVNAEFAQKISPAQTVEELKADIRKRITDEKKATVQQKFENAVLDELLSQTQFEVPSVLLDQQLTRLRTDLEGRLSADGLDLDKYAKMRQQTPEQIDAELRPEAEKRVKLAVLLTEVAKVENLNVMATEIESELTRLRALYPDTQMQAELAEPSTREELYNHLLATKTVRRILEQVEAS